MHEQTTEELLEGAPGEEYAGTAQIDGIEVEVDLRGHFEPLDGRFHWYGRIAANAELAERVRSGSTVTITTPHGTAEGRVSDIDTWGRFRITGTGRPPF
ncbi:MAG TPA: DUF4873 domain-containing protein [Marmoricola sp.]|nr:DUF4873 domain-containing protein [Marmoricola sp.]